jgi:hypothetical protein
MFRIMRLSSSNNAGVDRDSIEPVREVSVRDVPPQPNSLGSGDIRMMLDIKIDFGMS